jgi:hypothetical protein
VAEGQKGAISAAKVLALPRLRKTHLSLTLIEFAHALILMFWVGSLVGFAAVVIPALMSSLPSRELAAHAILAIFEQTAFLGCGAGAFLLLTTLLMHLFSLRAVRTTLLQVMLLLVMTSAAVASQLLLAPKLNGLIRTLQAPLDTLPVTDPTRITFARLITASTAALAVQITAGTGVLFFVVRRWYRYLPERKRARGIFDTGIEE